MTSIVTVNVSQIVAPTPSALQKTGALISQGGTILTSGTYAFLTQLADLTALLSSAANLTSLSWSSTNGGTVTATAQSVHGVAVGQTFTTTIAGATPAGYNGTVLATSTGTTTFTYPLATNPGSETVAGTFTPRGVGELVAMVTTFFAQGASQGVYVLEVGAGEPAAGVSALSTFLTANPGVFYAVLVPRAWDGVSSFLSLITSYESTTAKFYFFVTTTTGTYTSYTSLMKCVFAMVEAPGVNGTAEFTLASPFQNWLVRDPSSTNKATPFAFRYLYGVTPYPVKGNNALFSTLKSANINYVGTGSEGGISTAMLLWGTTADGRDASYWYSVDWAQINADLAIANTIINGSNNPLNPLYYNQSGINALQDTVADVMNSAITFGLAIGTVNKVSLSGPELAAALDDGAFPNQIVVNAVPFVPYLEASPGDYKTGTYKGLSVIYIPSRGFTQILFNLVVTDFAASM